MQSFLKLSLCCAVLFSSVLAEAAAPVLVINQDGSMQVMIDGADGKSILQDVGQVIDKRGGAPTPPPGNPPTTPPTTPPAAGDPVADQVKGWAAAVGDPTSAQALALVYRKVAELAPGKSRAAVMAALKQASDEVLGVTHGTEKWKDWRKNVSGLIDTHEQAGTVDYQKFCNSVASGLEQSASGAALDAAFIEMIIRLIMQIIQIFMGGGIGGV